MQHLFAGFFQLGYVTSDLDAALAAYKTRFGDTAFMINVPQSPDGSPPPTKRIALAWIDDVMTEIIEVDRDQKTIYDDALSIYPKAIRLHHLGYLIDDHPAMLSRLQALGYDVPLHGSFGDVLDYSYADTRSDLGHFCEFIRLGEAGKQFFGAVPRNVTKR